MERARVVLQAGGKVLLVVLWAGALSSVSALAGILIAAVVGGAAGVDAVEAIRGAASSGIAWWVYWMPWPLVAGVVGYLAHRSVGGGLAMGALVGALSASFHIWSKLTSETPMPSAFFALAGLTVCVAAAGGWFAAVRHE